MYFVNINSLYNLSSLLSDANHVLETFLSGSNNGTSMYKALYANNPYIFVLSFHLLKTSFSLELVGAFLSSKHISFICCQTFF